jgi:hypothetical protein
MLFKDESSVLTDVVLGTANLLGGAAPAVVGDGRVLHLGEATTGSRHARSALGLNGGLVQLETIGEVVVLNLSNGMLLFLLVPQVTPALGDHVTLLAKDRRHAVEGLDRERTGDWHGLGAGELNRLRSLAVTRFER